MRQYFFHEFKRLHRLHESPLYYRMSFMTGPRMPFTMDSRLLALIRAMQHTSPFFFQLVTAILSPALMPARSRTSLGSTICPRSSTVMIASTAQQPISMTAGAFFQALFAFLTIQPPRVSYF